MGHFLVCGYMKLFWNFERASSINYMMSLTEMTSQNLTEKYNDFFSKVKDVNIHSVELSCKIQYLIRSV